MKVFALLLLVGVSLTAGVPAQNGFSLGFPQRLFFELAFESPDKNVIMSPASVNMCLGLAYMGTDGVTAQEMHEVMGLRGNTKEETASSYASLMQGLKTHSRYGMEFSTANRIYVDQRYEIAQSFNALAAPYFDASAEKIDFGNPHAAAAKINEWIAEQTHNTIKNMLDAGALRSSVSVLVNAIYFKAKWAKEFSEHSTQKRSFFTSESDKKDVDMMLLQEHYEWADVPALDAQAVRIPYAYSDVYMMIMLPNKIDGLADMERKMYGSDLKQISDSFTRQLVNLQLPRFKFDFKVELREILMKMGLKSMFSSDANFSGLLKSYDKLQVSEVLHKAFIDVDEHGTEASAATVVLMAGSSMYSVDQPAIPKEFNVNHPFMFVIKDRSTIYFAGHVVKI